MEGVSPQPVLPPTPPPLAEGWELLDMEYPPQLPHLLRKGKRHSCQVGLGDPEPSHLPSVTFLRGDTEFLGLLPEAWKLRENGHLSVVSGFSLPTQFLSHGHGRNRTIHHCDSEAAETGQVHKANKLLFITCTFANPEYSSEKVHD